MFLRDRTSPRLICFHLFWFVVGGGWDLKCCVGSFGGRSLAASRGGGADLCSGVNRENKGTVTEEGLFSRVLLRLFFVTL